LWAGRNRPAQIVNAPGHDRRGACAGCQSVNTATPALSTALRLRAPSERGRP
jgi:hypothetical protein